MIANEQILPLLKSTAKSLSHITSIPTSSVQLYAHWREVAALIPSLQRQGSSTDSTSSLERQGKSQCPCVKRSWRASLTHHTWESSPKLRFTNPQAFSCFSSHFQDSTVEQMHAHSLLHNPWAGVSCKGYVLNLPTIGTQDPMIDHMPGRQAGLSQPGVLQRSTAGRVTLTQVHAGLYNYIAW